METAALWAVVVALAFCMAAVCVLVLQLLKQHGRLLLRLEQLDASANVAAVEAGQHAMPSGRPVGTVVEPFRLPTVEGVPVTMEEFSGKGLLLVHWHPGCGYCREIASELAELEPKLRANGTELLLLSYGTPEENRALAAEHGLRAPILLQDENRPIPAFEGLGTPVAYLLDGDGRIVAPLAFGALDVSELARATAQGRRRLSTERPLTQSRLLRSGLAAGTSAPPFSLAAIDGHELALADYRGRRVLLVFSDPDCGPCNELSPQLAEFERVNRDDLAVIMISRGGIDENRRKARQYGIDFPVVIQPGRRLAKEYGIFATPVAFLVDEHGVIARDVAHGPDEILALARSAAREEAPMH